MTKTKTKTITTPTPKMPTSTTRLLRAALFGLASMSLAPAAAAIAQDDDADKPLVTDEGAVKSDALKSAKERAKAAAREAAKKGAAETAQKRKDAGDPDNRSNAGTPRTDEPRQNPASVRRPTPPTDASSSSPSSVFDGPRVAQAETGEKPPPAKVDLTSCKPMTGKLNFNFEKATINELLDHISRIKCMNFILSDAVKGKNDITIVSRSPVTIAQAYAAFLSALEANGMALVPAGAFWKVIERKESAKANVPLYEMKDGALKRVTTDEKREGDMPDSDAQVTLLYDVKYANKDQVQNLVRNLMTKNADLQTPAGNLIILTDSGSNILRIMEVLDKIDIAGSSNQLNVVTLKWADVTSVSSKLQEIFGVGGDKKSASASRAVRPKAEGKDKVDEIASGDGDSDIGDVAIDKIIAEERTNQLLIISSPKAFERVLEVLRILDVPAPDGTNELRMWVMPLANSDAQKTASTMSSLAQGSSARKPATGDAKGGAKAKEAAQAAALFEGEVKVTADETTNSLVVVASSRDYRALKTVIEKLDARRPQVFIEAAIMEVALTQDRAVGLNAYAAAPVPIPGFDQGTGIFVAANEGGKQIFESSARVATGLQLLQQLADSNRLDATAAQQGLELVGDLSALIGVVGFVGPTIPVITDANGNALVSLPSVSTVLNLLQSNANVDILSTPHIMTTDNEKAEISVGQRVPVFKGFSFGGGAGGLGGLGLQGNVNYEDVKLKFTVTPHVNSNNEVRIELEQEVSDLGGNIAVGNGQTAPIITNRNIKNVVVAKDQQTIAIAGLIQDKKSDTESKVPFFGDIPIIGWLFKTWSDNKQKTNLLVVLTPYIVRTDEDFQKIYDRKMNERRAFVDAYFSDARVYNPYIDYDKKTGPLGELVKAIDWEMMKIENGGKGHGEELIGPDMGFKPRPVGGENGGADNGGGDHGGGGDGGGDGGGEPPPVPEVPPAPEVPPTAEPR